MDGIKGIEGVFGKLKEVLSGVGSAGRSGLHDFAKKLKAETVEQAPIDTEVLRLSIYISHGETPDELTVEVGSMGAINRETGEEYAVKQHEDLSFKHPRGGKAKYLEDPAMALSSSLSTILASKIVASLGGTKFTKDPDEAQVLLKKQRNEKDRERYSKQKKAGTLKTKYVKKPKKPSTKQKYIKKADRT